MTFVSTLVKNLGLNKETSLVNFCTVLENYRDFFTEEEKIEILEKVKGNAQEHKKEDEKELNSIKVRILSESYRRNFYFEEGKKVSIVK